MPSLEQGWVSASVSGNAAGIGTVLGIKALDVCCVSHSVQD